MKRRTFFKGLGALLASVSVLMLKPRSVKAAVSTPTSIGNTTGKAVTTVALTTTANVPAGSCIILGISSSEIRMGGPSITDSVGNIYILHGFQLCNATAADGALYIFYCNNCINLPNGGTITVTHPITTSATTALTACYVTGQNITQTSTLFPGDPREYSASTSAGLGGNTSGSSTSPTGTLHRTPAQASCLAIGFVATNGPSGDTFTQAGSWTSTPGRAGTTGGTAASNWTIAAGYLVTSTASTYAPTITSRPWAELIIVIQPPVSPTTWWVATTGSDGNTGTRASPFLTANHAASVANVGDTIRFVAGTYSITNAEQFQVWFSGLYYLSDTPLGAKLVPSAVTQPPSTVLLYLTLGSDNCVVDGFDIDATGAQTNTITSGIYTYGSNVEIKNCRVRNIFLTASASGSGGSCIEIDGFYGGRGGAIHNCITGRIASATGGRQQTFHGTYVSNWGGVVYNNIIFGAYNGYGINAWHGATRNAFYNNLIFDCAGGLDFGSGDIGTGNQANYWLDGNDHTVLFNNICYNGNTAIGTPVYGFRDEVAAGTGGIVGANNSSSNNFVGGSNIDTPYTFPAGTVSDVNHVGGTLSLVNYQQDGSGNYHYSAGSAGLNAGISSLGSISAPSYDYDGLQRPTNNAYDLGPYEFAKTVGIPPWMLR